MSWFDDLLDYIDDVFGSGKSSNNKPIEKPAKHVMTVAEAMAKLEELNNIPHLEELKYISGFGEPENYMLKKDDKYSYGHTSLQDAKTIFYENDILTYPKEIDDFSKFKCNNSSTNIEKLYTVKTFLGWKESIYGYGYDTTEEKKLRVVYYNLIDKYVLIVTKDYSCHYVSKPYDDWKTLQQEVLTLAEIIKLEKEIKELATKELEEIAWG